MIEMKCKICNKVFKVNLCKIKKGGGKYCSKGCYHKDIPNLLGKKEKRNCIICNNIFYTTPARTKKICSVKCLRKEKIHKTCITCKKDFLVFPYMKDSKFCSRKCKNKSQVGFIPWNKGKKLKPISEEHRKRLIECNSGSKHPQWKGGISFDKYPQNWKESFKESIRQRDGHKCFLCKIDENDLKGFYNKLDIHHIDYNKHNLDPKNLISLCRSCHTRTNHSRDKWVDHFNRVLFF